MSIIYSVWCGFRESSADFLFITDYILQTIKGLTSFSFLRYDTLFLGCFSFNPLKHEVAVRCSCYF